MRRQSCLHALLLTVLTLGTLALKSQQSLAAAPILETNPSAWPARTVTAEGRVRVVITKQKPKLHLAKKSRPVILLRLNDDESDYYDQPPDLQIGYRRPELVNQTADNHDDISDEIKIRLVLARKRALEAYTKKWA
jgi:hypothetical protein